MVNTRRKGNRAELEAVKELEKKGYLVYRVKGSVKFNKNVDIFGIADILAIKKNETKLVQVKSNIRPDLRPFELFKQKFPQITVEIWIRKDREGFKILSCG